MATWGGRDNSWQSTGQEGRVVPDELRTGEAWQWALGRAEGRGRHRHVAGGHGLFCC